MPLLTSPQFVEWMAFYQVDPFGGVRGDVQAGIIASTIANVNRDPKKRRKPYGVQDFMAFIEHKKENVAAKVRAAMRTLKDGK